jgi:hypothetical protein
MNLKLFVVKVDAGEKGEKDTEINSRKRRY